MNESILKSVPVSRMRQIGTLVDLVGGMPKKDPRFALFLGAGASISSGIPTTSQLITKWKRRLFLDKDKKKGAIWRPHYEEDFRDWEKKRFARWKADWQAEFGRQPNDYALLFSYAYSNADARQGFVESIVSGCEPGPGYIYLAAMALAGYFQTFLTTNFDDLIHDALFRYAGLKPMVCAFDSQVSSIRLPSPRPKIIKLHGDFLFTNIRSIGNELSYLDQNMQDKFERTCESYGLIVIGYSGQDQSVIAPLRSMLHKRDRLTHGLHWCVYHDRSRADEPNRLIPEELNRMWEAYPDKVHLYDTGSFDDVMENFFIGCHCSPPPELAQPEEKALYARLRDGIENADQTWRLQSHFSRMLAQFREATARTPSKVLKLLDESDQEQRDGITHMKKGRFDQAHKSFESAAKKGNDSLLDATPMQQVRAFRRKSGSMLSSAELIVKRANSKNIKRLPSSTAKEFERLSTEARDDVRSGLRIDHGLTSPPELRGHRLNLWYNGLLSDAYLLYINVTPSPEEFVEALKWLEDMSKDELFGDEYVALVREDIGGKILLDRLYRLSSKIQALET